MGRYIIKREGVTATTGQDVLTIISATSRRCRVVEFNAVGQGSSSAAQAFTISRAAAGTTPGGAIVASKADHSDQPAAAFTTATTWSVQPTPETNGITTGFNALGIPFSRAWPDGVLEARNGECISIRAPSGQTPQACNLSITIEED
jgi:hypothetical protein